MFAIGIVVLCFSVLVVHVSAEDVVVKLSHGGEVVGGVMKSQNGRKFYSFKGIPFAEPPTGAKRFQPPIPKAAWQGIRDATQFGPMCTQINPLAIMIPAATGEEDCLYMNVYTPEIPRKQSNDVNKKAVLVWMYGGGFFGGETMAYRPGRIMDDPNVIVVAANYRVGAFGFLSTNDSASPGNYGLMDQSLALKWVHDNIEAFGGDVNHVTIFGENAGGASTGYHLLSPMSSGLFQNAISISGSPLCPWAFKPDPMYWAKKLGDALKCPTDQSTDLVECLKSISAEAIVLKSTELMNKGLMTTFIFGPTIDGKFLLDSPRSIMRNGKVVNKVPLITGINRDEALTFYQIILMSHRQADLNSKDSMIEVLGEIMDDTGRSSDVIRHIVEKYLSGIDVNNAEQVRDTFVKMLTHAGFEMGHYETVALRSKHRLPTYAYQLDYDPSIGFLELAGSTLKGVSHGDDLVLQFDGPVYGPVVGSMTLNENDKKISNVILSLWTNFAKFGNPTPNTSDILPIRWQSSMDEKFPVYHIDNPITVTTYDTSKEELYHFWVDEVQKALN